MCKRRKTLIILFPCFCFTHTNSVSLKSSRMRKGGSSALMKYSCQCVCESACFARQRSVFVWLKERMCVRVCRQVCVEHAAYQWRFAQQLCTDTVSGRGMERGLGWGEEWGESECSKARGEGESDSPDWGRDAESRQRGLLDFCQCFPATAKAGIDSFFPPSFLGICLFHCFPWEFCQWASSREERKRAEERSAAERDDVPPPSLDAEVRATLEGSGKERWKVDCRFGLQTHQFPTGEQKS